MDFVHLVDCDSAEETRAAGAKLGSLLTDGNFVALNGSLGAGKTTFSQGIGMGLTVGEVITSPTFNIVSEYNSGRIPLYHFDLYRLEDEMQLEDINFYELVDSSTPGAALVEWADMFADEMPDDLLEVCIQTAGKGEDCARTISARATGPKSKQLLESWQSALG